MASDVPAWNSDFLDLLECLSAAHADFLVVGAFALSQNGLPRATGDLDVLVRANAENAPRVLTALRAFGAPLESAGITLDDLSRPGTTYQMGLPPRRIDLLTQLSGIDFDEAWAGRIERRIGSGSVACQAFLPTTLMNGSEPPWCVLGGVLAIALRDLRRLSVAA